MAYNKNMKIKNNKVKVTKETEYEIVDFKVMKNGRKAQLEKLIAQLTEELSDINKDIKSIETYEAK